MQLWLDTANIAAIKKATESGLLYGVTTNPSIFAKEEADGDKLLQDLLNVQPGFVAVQVTRTKSVDEMVKQAISFSRLNPGRIVVKIPSTPMGFAAMKKLKTQNVLVLATAISTISQFIAAATVGADYAALYLSHMQSANKDIFAEMKAMLALADKNHWKTNLMGAAFADAPTAQQTLAAGVGSVTVPEAIFNQLFAIEPQVKKQLDQFEADWAKYEKNQNAGILFSGNPSSQNQAIPISWLNSASADKHAQIATAEQLQRTFPKL
jgi:TalC/MipB family fructose-6-phosphate aldolase